MSTTAMIIIITTMRLASATRHACDEDAARALKRPWAPVVFHGERETESLPEIDKRFTKDGYADEAAGFRAVDDFNEMEPIPALGKAYVPGSPHRARSLARRAATDEPLRFAVFGNSFTIGSNCGESTTQHQRDCAWPSRLARRLRELRPGRPPEVWHSYQKNGEASVDVAQQLPAIARDLTQKPDVVILDLSIGDALNGEWHWFEVVVRGVLTLWPDAVVIVVVSAIPVIVRSGSEEWLAIARHYGLCVVDLATAARAQRRADRVDRIWPQALHYVDSAGKPLLQRSKAARARWEAVAANEGAFFAGEPRVRVTKGAAHPQNHPPWTTHQLLADALARAFFLEIAAGCKSCRATPQNLHPIPSQRVDCAPGPTPPMPATTVGPADEIASRPLCLHARTVLDPARGPSDDVEIVSGDWRLNKGSTPRDDRGRRSGWLSDKPGSLIRFRVDAAGAQLSITYLASFANFGSFRVWAGKPHSPGAVSVEVDGRRDRFSLPRVARFPSTSELMRALRRSGGGDLFIENAGATDGPSRVKILGVVSADCH